MDKILKQFYDSEVMRETVKEFFLENLRLMAIERVFNKEDTTGIFEAQELIKKSFDSLSEKYGIIKETDLENQAR